jgi:hypothetical protein
VLDFGRAFGTGKGKAETQNGEGVASSTASWLPLSLAVFEETLKGILFTSGPCGLEICIIYSWRKKLKSLAATHKTEFVA